MAKQALKIYTLQEMEDKFIGKRGTPGRERYELKLSKELLGRMIKKTRQERRLTQEQLGVRVGVQKAQISKLESGSNSATISTILKVFSAMKAEVHFQVTIEGKPLKTGY